MTPAQADTVLAQWAVWAFDDTRTGYAIGSWQKDWRPNFDPEYADVLSEIIDRVGAGDEAIMLMVDASLSRLGRHDARNAHVIRTRYRFGNQYSPKQLDEAIRQFIISYEAVLDENSRLYGLTVSKRTATV